LLVFDFDGVLVDSEVIANDVVASVLTALGHPTTASDCHHRFTGLVVPDIRRVIEAGSEQPLAPDFEERVREESRRRFAQELKPVPGASDLLRVLGGRRCIASNSGPSWIERGLQITGLEAFFPPGAIFSAAHVARAKPAPDLFLHAAASMGVAPGNCVVIEDSVHGATGARAAGMRVLGFTGASHIEDGHGELLRRAGVEEVFDDLTRLPALLRRL
jgi:HAD superfamily hydrolase (TIGR01509 family)